MAGKEFIRASYVARYCESPFLLWADVHADKEQKDELTSFQQMLFEKGDVHEQEVIDSLYPQSQELSLATGQEGFAQVLDLLKQGVDCVTQPPLYVFDQHLQGRPDIIEKQEGSSDFGNYYYVVKEIKFAKNIKQKHILQAAFYTKILGEIQGCVADEFVLINREHEEFVYSYSEYKEVLEEMIIRVREILSGKYTPLASYKEDWPWTSLSKQLALQNNDLTLLFKLGSSLRNRLHEVNITTLDEFVAANKADVLSVKGIGSSTYTRLYSQATALLEDKPIVISQPSLPQDVHELYFDIEGDTELGIDYLYGILDGDSFVYFWADSPQDEQEMWTSFCEYVSSLPKNTVLYHYSSYEKQSISRLYKKYGCDTKLYNRMHLMLVDLFPVVTKSVYLPIYSYSIKSVASYLGFDWDANDAGGANSMQWYQQYLQGDVDIKKKILQYNRDDVVATRVVKEYVQTLKK